jgi:hypothetical protein
MGMVHCMYEPGDFDESAFTADPEHGLVHDVSPRHTKLGDLVEGGDPNRRPRTAAAPQRRRVRPRPSKKRR